MGVGKDAGWGVVDVWGGGTGWGSGRMRGTGRSRGIGVGGRLDQHLKPDERQRIPQPRLASTWHTYSYCDHTPISQQSASNQPAISQQSASNQSAISQQLASNHAAISQQSRSNHAAPGPSSLQVGGCETTAQCHSLPRPISACRRPAIACIVAGRAVMPPWVGVVGEDRAVS